jgi:tripartite-type tricarboxylate transporter receptor subunit TctC
MKMKILSLAVLLMQGLCQLGFSQDVYPSKAIHVLVPFAPGASDAQIRALGPIMSQRLGQPLIIDNMPGGGGAIAATQAKNAAPNGYTLFFTGMATLTMLPAMRKDVGYKLSDFTTLGNISTVTGVMIIHPSPNYNNIDEFIKYARSNPGKLNFGSPGVGTAGHTMGVGPEVYGDFLMTHIPYKGGAEVVSAVIAGNVDVGFALPNIVIPHLQNNTIKALAVTAGKRSEFLPDVATYKELGINYGDGESYGLVGPKGLPPAIVNKISSAIAEATKDEGFLSIMRKSYTSVQYLNADEYLNLLNERNAAWDQYLANPKFVQLLKQ